MICSKMKSAADGLANIQPITELGTETVRLKSAPFTLGQLDRLSNNANNNEILAKRGLEA